MSHESKSAGESVKIYEMSFYNQPPEFFVRYKDIAHLLNPAPKGEGLSGDEKWTIEKLRDDHPMSQSERSECISDLLAIISRLTQEEKRE